MGSFEIEIINLLRGNQLVAEVYYNSFQWAEVSEEQEKLVVKFYSHPNKEHWEFPCEEAIKALEQAKTRLLMTRNKGTLLERMIPVDPQEVNERAQKALEAILDHPERTMIQGELRRFGQVIDIYAPDCGGARYTIAGEFIGFLEP